MTLTTNTAQDITLIPGRVYAVMASGAFGGGTLTFLLKETFGTTLAMPTFPTLVNVAGGFEFRAPCDKLNVALTGSTAAVIQFTCQLCPT